VQLREIVELSDDGATDKHAVPCSVATALTSIASTWAGPNTRSAWSTTASSTGRNPAIRARDIDQQAELEALGWRIIRVSAEMLGFARTLSSTALELPAMQPAAETEVVQAKTANSPAQAQFRAGP
jgi:hypothetical protein